MTQPSNELRQPIDCGFNFENSYLNLPDLLYTKLAPVAVSSPEIVVFNEAMANSMDLNFQQLNQNDQAMLFSGNSLPKGAEPFAQAYAGHQFGHFTMLGDGRAHVLGEHIMSDGKRVDVQLKGSGMTPYSRRGDGRAAIGPMLREYIISEAMHHLGVPTTRSLAVVTTGEDIIRETYLPGAILTRVASSHIRVGTFELVAAKQNRQLLKKLLDYTVNRHMPEIKGESNIALSFLKAISDRQADLIVNWMRVGFIHGVMNTDNMAISGETIDYGPCAFMDAYDPNTVFSSIDHMGRYAYANQPMIAQWNLARLAETLIPLMSSNIDDAIELAKDTITSFTDIYQRKWEQMMRSKLGLFDQKPGDNQLIKELFDWMKTNHADYTNTFYELSKGDKPTGKVFDDRVFSDWFDSWQDRLTQNKDSKEASLTMMKKHNPVLIPRNHQVEAALTAATEGDYTPFNELLAVLIDPYKNCESKKPYQSPPPPSERVYQTFCGT